MTTTRHAHHPSQGTIRHREQNAPDRGGFEVRGCRENSAEGGCGPASSTSSPTGRWFFDYEMSSRKSITEHLAVLRFTAPFGNRTICHHAGDVPAALKRSLMKLRRTMKPTQFRRLLSSFSDYLLPLGCRSSGFPLLSSGGCG